MIDDSKHEEQLGLMKKQVKAIMEEAVMKKFIHEESPSVLQLCATVEQCLLDGVKRRAVGFMRSNKLANLYSKVGKAVPAVQELIKQIEEAEAKIDGSNDLEHKFDRINLSSSIIATANGHKNPGKHLWVRMALTNKLLDKIVDYLVQNNSKFYHPSSIMADPVKGRLLATLLIGPCTFDYTKLKTQDHYWTDPPADELLQRHKLHSRARPSPRGKRPTLNLAPLHPTSSSDSLDCNACFREYVESLHQNSKISLLYGKNNVVVKPEEVGPVPGYLSLHQQGSKMMIKWTPNQLMQEEEACIQGKLTESNGVYRNESVPTENQNNTKFSKRKSREIGSTKNNIKPSSFWKFVISVDIRDIVYLHCHHQVEKGGTLVLVGQDGVQWPPILFPPGGHLLSFLSCLENGLRPFGYLDPPLWSEKGKGKVFPRLRRRSRRSESSSDSDDLTDFVFRVGFTSDSSNMTSSNGMALKRSKASDIDLMTPISTLPALWSKSFSNGNQKPVLVPNTEPDSVPVISRSVVIKRDLKSRSTVPTTRKPVQPVYQNNQKKAKKKTGGRQSFQGVLESTDEYVPNLDMYTWDQSKPRHYNEPTNLQELASSTARSGSLKTLCESMRRQILFRAFYGWLAHCRHLSGVRTHLTALVNNSIIPPDHPTDASVGVTDEIWDKLTPNGVLTDIKQLARFVYYGGVKSSRLRPLIWMYLLGHYSPGSDVSERLRVDEESRRHYEEVRAIDEEIKKNYNGNTAIPVDVLLSSSSIDKTSWTSSYVPAPFLRQRSSLISDVFTPGPETNTPKQDQFDIPDEELKKLGRRNRSLKEKRKQLLKRTKSDDSHVPYSSVSTVTSAEPWSSFSMKSFSFDGDYDTLKTVVEESEKSSENEARNSNPEESGSIDRSSDDRSLRRLTDSLSSRSESIDPISLNLTQIEKDVHRCDRNHNYFTQEANLQKLSNIMSCFVWENPEIGYVQGMCDLAAPLLVLLDEESLVYSCFGKLMERITFQKGNKMDIRLDNLRSLVQALDSELFEHLHAKNDEVPFFFCYRWFLLEFKRELSYDEDVYAVWECSWAATICSTPDFGLFFALAMLENYRDVILENDMDFPAIVKFFNEMAEKHDASKLLKLTRKLIYDVQCMIQK